VGAANAWSRPLNFVSTQMTQPPTHPYSFNQPRDLSTRYHFTPPQDIQQHSRQDPRLAHNANYPCCIRSNMPTQNSSVYREKVCGLCNQHVFAGTGQDSLSLSLRGGRG
jgi:hypothetical protein